jgi:hypothetical protein
MPVVLDDDPVLRLYGIASIEDAEQRDAIGEFSLSLPKTQSGVTRHTAYATGTRDARVFDQASAYRPISAALSGETAG